ncbi:hypothetical protein CERZMDRAFT_89904 [Cercospora zeae-maydis SCOH1-5]|uniref:Uncharacterized protein n=1 Tax=Cercospora zeae-maydis SCOH1-5 TaxID=717836 RepID=A0A6A6FTK7_9PEZI|nr:hypothetical protein CERZMDRAFT_89904 [Cercospora zeae-maydis SCOH1-5]
MPSEYIVEICYDSPKPKPTIKAFFKSSSGDGSSSSCEKWNVKHDSSSAAKQTQAMQDLMKTAKTKLEGKGHGVSAMKAVGSNMRAKTTEDGKERYWGLRQKKGGKVVMRAE